jgi:DNA modification methylase
MKTYQQFLEEKIVVAERSGFDVDVSQLHALNKPHQNAAIRWAANLGRALIAMSFGLGKTRIQCDLARLIHERTDKPFLVVCPLGVKHQFSEEDGPAMGMQWQYVRNDAELLAAKTPYLITNYERVRDGNISAAMIASNIGGVSLDEGSVLRSLGSKTSDIFKRVFAPIAYRYVCTATPAPNEYKELIYYAEFLGIKDHGESLTRWFKRTTSGKGSAGHLVLMDSQAENFWMWVSTWALFVSRPSDLNYPDDGYVMPEMQIHWHRLSIDYTRAWEQVDNYGQRRLIPDATAGVSEASAENKATLNDRVAKMQEILATDPGAHWIIWHHREDERRAIENTVPGVVTVYGSQELEERERRILAFSRGKVQIFASKPELAGSGCNFQHYCHKAIYIGVDPSSRFQDFIQSIHRLQRFMQKHAVEIHIIYAESEDGIVSILKRKWKQHDELIAKMQAIIKTYGLSVSAIKNGLSRSLGVTRMENKQKLFTAVNNDCVMEMPKIASNSIDAVITSIPFSNHYEYVASYNDFGHNTDDGKFFEQMDFLIPELYRVLIPGRLAAIHVKDLIRYGHVNASGFMETSMFSYMTWAAFKKHGFLFGGEIFITTDVVRENNNTYRLGWTEMCKDGSKMGVGLPEKILLFRKPPSSSATAYADKPIVHKKETYTRARWQVDAHSYWRSNGNALVYTKPYDYEAHVDRLERLEGKNNLPSTYFAEPPKSNNLWVWDDVNPMLCLNSEQARRKLEAHVCPLPLDIAKRLIERTTSDPEVTGEAELILDPFAGLFTVPYQAILMGRRGYGIELSEDSFRAGAKYCQMAQDRKLAPTLFDLLSISETAPAESVVAGLNGRHGG